MVGRFAPPPTVRANTRWRLLVLRTIKARRFAPSPYAGADAPRHHPPLQLHCSYPESQRRHSMLRRPHRRFQTKVCTRSAQNGSPPSSVDPRLSVPEATLFRNVRKLRSPISIPRTFNTSTQAQSASCTIHVLLIFVSCSLRPQSIYSHGTLYSEVCNAHRCRKLAQADWLILENIAPGLSENAILA